MNRNILTCLLPALMIVIPGVVARAAEPLVDRSSNETATGQLAVNGDTPWIVMAEDFANPAIQEAIRDAERDWYKVFGYPPVIFRDNTRGSWNGPVIAFGSAANTRALFESDVPEGKEQFRVTTGKVKHNPAITAVGADTRGTIYAIYTFCEEVLGVDPMYVFTDNQPKKRNEISVAADFDVVSKEPTFEYRGWFINDEELHDGMHRDPLGGNVISMEWMDKILETLLRCKGNMIAPESAPYSDATVYELCKRRDVVITFHHILPVGLNMMDWPKGVPFSFVDHKDILIDAWTKSAKVLADKKVAWTIGFRGESDGAFWNSDPAAPKDDVGRAAVIAEAMQVQTEIIRKIDPDATIIAALWNEQGKFYNEGLLKVPDGVCKMFADDGRGYMRDKGDGSDLSPGDGLYYHVMMMMNTQNRTTEGVPPARFYSELKRYVEKDATKYAIINVSGIRPAAMSVEAITDFLWDARPALSKSPEESMRDYLTDWYARQFSLELASELTDLRLQYYDIPYVREKMPIQGRWHGARGEHLIQYLTQEMLKQYSKAIQNGEDLQSISGFENQFNQAKEPLAETAEYFPPLWAKTKQLEDQIPADRKDFYQAHFTYQVAVHMYSCRMLAIVNNAFKDYLKNRDPQAFAKNIEPALAELEKVLVEAHKAEYGIWDTMFMHVRLMDMWRTRLLLKSTIAKIQGEPYTDEYRGFMRGSFWGSAQDYMEYSEGVFPYFYKHSGRGLEVLESGEPLPEKIHQQEPTPPNDLIGNVEFDSKNAYEVVPNGFRSGAVLWTDRGFKVGEIPAELDGATYIRTPMEDRANPSGDLISFTLKKDSVIYVGLKDEVRKLPVWLADWEATGMSVNASNKLLLYRKKFQAKESAVLGSLVGSGVSAMYTVVIHEQ
ncbi:glycosyl hydrolase 115 family protein [Aporhodopirellula aestuarii]|uniref:Glycosyl hydrolase 115 family protein n=1 Tax=Aporhodopirellula aestuarii TaxID=2950107 RepID=A0ABT0UD10_9BACT|nr:glycosyl hydrolase 115 family protein [Aporhodopirellula aestuarii]MCM2374907.1 glycosyl hydrolase 115 family protein [Aporhodopirellula aestuarii]